MAMPLERYHCCYSSFVAFNRLTASRHNRDSRLNALTIVLVKGSRSGMSTATLCIAVQIAVHTQPTPPYHMTTHHHRAQPNTHTHTHTPPPPTTTTTTTPPPPPTTTTPSTTTTTHVECVLEEAAMGAPGPAVLPRGHRLTVGDVQCSLLVCNTHFSGSFQAHSTHRDCVLASTTGGNKGLHRVYCVRGNCRGDLNLLRAASTFKPQAGRPAGTEIRIPQAQPASLTSCSSASWRSWRSRPIVISFHSTTWTRASQARCASIYHTCARRREACVSIGQRNGGVRHLTMLMPAALSDCQVTPPPSAGTDSSATGPRPSSSLDCSATTRTMARVDAVSGRFTI
jgi:hypothetical protein